MTLAAFVLSGLSMSASAAEQFTAKLTAFNPTTGLMVFNDRTTIGVDRSIVEGKLEIGATVTVYFESTDDGFQKIIKIKIDPPGTPPPK
jgi:hypothetical protein